jgi:hypothetical protein
MFPLPVHRRSHSNRPLSLRRSEYPKLMALRNPLVTKILLHPHHMPLLREPHIHPYHSLLLQRRLLRSMIQRPSTATSMIRTLKEKKMLRTERLVRRTLYFVLMTRSVSFVNMIRDMINFMGSGCTSKEQVEMYLERWDDPHQWKGLLVREMHRVSFAGKHIL